METGLHSSEFVLHSTPSYIRLKIPDKVDALLVLLMVKILQLGRQNAQTERSSDGESCFGPILAPTRKLFFEYCNRRFNVEYVYNFAIKNEQINYLKGYVIFLVIEEKLLL